LEQTMDKLHLREGHAEAWREYGFDSLPSSKIADSGPPSPSSKSAWLPTFSKAKPGGALGAPLGMPALSWDLYLQSKPPPGRFQPCRPAPPSVPGTFQSAFQPTSAFEGIGAAPLLIRFSTAREKATSPALVPPVPWKDALTVTCQGLTSSIGCEKTTLKVTHASSTGHRG
jgi:hypothetical protein